MREGLVPVQIVGKWGMIGCCFVTLLECAASKIAKRPGFVAELVGSWGGLPSQGMVTHSGGTPFK